MAFGGPPVWSPDGSTIYWRSGRALMATEVTTTPDFRAGKTRKLFSGPYRTTFDVLPDGRFVMATLPSDPAATGQGPPVARRDILLTNWLATVEARLSGKR